MCANSECRTKYSIMDIRRRMNIDLETMENQIITMLNQLEMPDFNDATIIK